MVFWQHVGASECSVGWILFHRRQRLAKAADLHAGLSHCTRPGDSAHAVAQGRNRCTLVLTNLSFGSTASSNSMEPLSIPGALSWCSRWARNLSRVDSPREET